MAKRLTKDQFIKKAKQIHRNSFDYSKVNYVNIKTKVILTCNSCRFTNLVEPHCHLNGNKCQKCSRIQQNKKQRYSHNVKNLI